jgi:hypothetical protein
MVKRWSPTSLESKCLQHLDAAGSWEMLRAATPSVDDVLPWRPFRRVFGFNFGLFLAVFVGIFFVIEIPMATDAASIREDLPYGMAGALILTVLFSAFVMHLYRQSWNRRARHIREMERE